MSSEEMSMLMLIGFHDGNRIEKLCSLRQKISLYNNSREDEEIYEFIDLINEIIFGIEALYRV